MYLVKLALQVIAKNIMTLKYMYVQYFINYIYKHF